jgi:hypothetical protein
VREKRDGVDLIDDNVEPLALPFVPHEPRREMRMDGYLRCPPDKPNTVDYRFSG